MTATGHGGKKATPAGQGLRPATAPPGLTESDDDEERDPLAFEPLRLTKVKDGPPPRRVPLFTITTNGEEHVYTVLADPQPNMRLEYGHKVRTIGAGNALDWLLEQMLGTDGYAALRGHEELTDENISWVMDKVLGIALGTLQVPKDS